MSVEKRCLSLSLGLLTAACLSFLAPSAVSARPPLTAGDLELFQSDDGMWLVGCVRDDLAERLVAHAGFVVGPQPEVPARLCIQGETYITRRLR
ncbi:MAG: hypothetical protein WEG36_14475 [Gemmatimonadota bacterium]